MKILNIIRSVTESYYIIVGLALFFGLFYSSYVVNLANYSTIILAIIFFLSSLKIDLREVKKYLGDKKTLVVANVLILFVLPFVVYYFTNLLFPTIATAFLLLAVMPAGMTAPLLSEISGGRQSLALVITITTSLLAPITVPLMIKFLIGADIEVSFWDMFILLATVIYIPFMTAQFLKRFLQTGVDKVSGFFKPLSVLLLGLLIMVVVARQANVILEGLRTGEGIFLYLGLLFIFFTLLHILGYFFVAWGKNHSDKIAITVCITYMNFTLAIELANKFFTEPNIIIPVVFSVIPWSLMFLPFKYLVYKK